jgi:uncharacterized protein (TIGR00106 family)
MAFFYSRKLYQNLLCQKVEAFSCLGGDNLSSINVSFQVIPAVPLQDIYSVVDRAIEVVARSGVKYEVGPMETTMEGELDELLEIVKKAQQACIEAGAGRVLTIIKIDYAPGGVTMQEKIGKYRP